MNYLYLLSQTENCGYDTYDSCVVCSTSPQEAVKIRPDERKWDETYKYGWIGDWAITIDSVKCELIGIADESIEVETIIIKSYNAG